MKKEITFFYTFYFHLRAFYIIICGRQMNKFAVFNLSHAHTAVLTQIRISGLLHWLLEVKTLTLQKPSCSVSCVAYIVAAGSRYYAAPQLSRRALVKIYLDYRYGT